ncbi:CidA/LrgA family protein [Hansschlegelia zhihuaiae]|uniref:CidA/LrgA family protein n=1 Tax=Hansschlegelia zhihuaiae TaxID=405005 RepID=A0A4V1KJ31_9HYPH|nr:CidA/LrgA family protein [Hansschlegelia zhihuaiae]RXF72772.1 CidA/LrgA family protein [Hansschlegelia zhihuaiae]
MLLGLFLLLFCQLIGEAAARALGLPVPGPVIGVLLLLSALFVRNRLVRGRDDETVADDRQGAVGEAADGLLRHLGLLFVPAGVGIAQSYQALDGQLIAVAAALVGSTVITLIVTVATFRLVARRLHKDGRP